MRKKKTGFDYLYGGFNYNDGVMWCNGDEFNILRAKNNAEKYLVAGDKGALAAINECHTLLNIMVEHPREKMDADWTHAVARKLIDSSKNARTDLLARINLYSSEAALDIKQEISSILRKELHYKDASIEGSRMHLFKKATVQYALVDDERYQKTVGLKKIPMSGDELKTEILANFKRSLDEVLLDISSEERGRKLDAVINLFKASDEYKVLKTSQGFYSYISGKKTSSDLAVDELITDAKSVATDAMELSKI
jgi:hypothetical protein